jgi:hypothetical protein
MIGIVIENYSKYLLSDPRTSENRNCPFNREINAPQPVKPGTFEIFAVDNTKGYLERRSFYLELICFGFRMDLMLPESIYIISCIENNGFLK